MRISILLLFLALLFSACKKETTPEPSKTPVMPSFTAGVIADFTMYSGEDISSNMQVGDVMIWEEIAQEVENSVLPSHPAEIFQITEIHGKEATLRNLTTDATSIWKPGDENFVLYHANLSEEEVLAPLKLVSDLEDFGDIHSDTLTPANSISGVDILLFEVSVNKQATSGGAKKEVLRLWTKIHKQAHNGDPAVEIMTFGSDNPFVPTYSSNGDGNVIGVHVLGQPYSYSFETKRGCWDEVYFTNTSFFVVEK